MSCLLLYNDIKVIGETVMSTSIEFVDYVYENLKPLGDIKCKKMFGEYGLWYKGKFFGCICDNQLFIKDTDSGRKILGKDILFASPYQGAKEHIVIENIEDKNTLIDLIINTYDELIK